MTESALTLSELQTRFSDEADDTTDSTLAKVGRWFNDCQNKTIVGKRLRCRLTSTTIAVASSDSKGDLPSDFDEESIVYDTTNDKVLEYKPYDLMLAGDPDGSQSTSEGPHVYSFPSTSELIVWANLDADLTLSMQYYALPTAIDSDTVSVIPNQFRADVLVNFALFKYFLFKDDSRAKDYLNLYVAARDAFYAWDKKARNRENKGFSFSDDVNNRPYFTPQG